MKTLGNEKLTDLFHEFMIFMIFGLGIAAPVIIYNFMDIITSVVIPNYVHASAFTGAY